jgi:non-ribosomal peptide synthetase component F
MEADLPEGCRGILTSDLEEISEAIPLEEVPVDRQADAYVLFTSGSSGKPKGVRISFASLDAFLGNFMAYPGYDFNSTDRFLQLYDLSFDGALPAWLPALLSGASVYTVPPGEIKYLAAYKLMQEQQLTCIKMPPSVLHLLRPYFSSIHLPAVKYCLFGGEALDVELVREFARCLPNAMIQNVYGPTECTVIATVYDFRLPGWEGLKGRAGKSWKNTVSIGRPLGNGDYRIMRSPDEACPPGTAGELWLTGEQVSSGYFKRPDLDESAFVDAGKSNRYYRTGDLVMEDEDGDLMFLGRMDEQVQVQGYRVEPGDIEACARAFLGELHLQVLAGQQADGGTVLYLAIETGISGNPGENATPDLTGLRSHLVAHLPSYMVPAHLHCMRAFPRLVSGKVDRQALLKEMEG